MNYKQFTDKYLMNYRLDLHSTSNGTKITLSWVQFQETIEIDSVEDIQKGIDSIANLLHSHIQEYYHPNFLTRFL